MRHCPGDVGLTARATTQECTQIGGNGPSASFWGICVHYWAVGLGCGWPWDRNSVHKWEDRASPCCFGAFVYTVGLLRCCGQMRGRNSVHKWEDQASPRRFGAFVYTVATRVTIRIATRAAPGGTSASATTACRRRPLAGPSRLVGKTDSERVAPLPGWHLRRGVNPHEPLKSQRWDLFKVGRTVASTPAYLHEHMEFHRFNPNATGIYIFLCHDQVPVQ